MSIARITVHTVKYTGAHRHFSSAPINYSSVTLIIQIPFLREGNMIQLGTFEIDEQKNPFSSRQCTSLHFRSFNGKCA